MESSMQEDLLQYVSIQVLQLKRILESASSNIPPVTPHSILFLLVNFNFNGY